MLHARAARAFARDAPLRFAREELRRACFRCGAQLLLHKVDKVRLFYEDLFPAGVLIFNVPVRGGGARSRRSANARPSAGLKVRLYRHRPIRATKAIGIACPRRTCNARALEGYHLHVRIRTSRTCPCASVWQQEPLCVATLMRACVV